MIVAAHQPNYLPWLGYYDKIMKCDIFIIEDTMQFERHGYTCRNRVRTNHGVKWLTVPIKRTGKLQSVNEVEIANYAEDWAQRHWLTLKYSYCKAPFYEEYNGFFEEAYSQRWTMLIDLNMHLLKGVMKMLGIEKPLVMASSLDASGKGTELLIAQSKALGADVHLFGVGGRKYLNLKRFEEENIKVVFQEFEYPVYAHPYGDFIPNLSVVDYLFYTGGKPWKMGNKELRRHA